MSQLSIKASSPFKISRTPSFRISNVHYMPSFKRAFRLEHRNVYIWFVQVVLSIAVTLT